MKALSGQSVFDLSVQSSGSIEAAVELAVMNGLSLSDGLEAGVTLIEPSIISSQIVGYYGSRGIMPATAISTQTDTPATSDLGIEFWTIETDFIIN